MNDILSKTPFAGEKLLADPEQIPLLLPGQGHAGPYAGMNEKEITAGKRESGDRILILGCGCCVVNQKLKSTLAL